MKPQTSKFRDDINGLRAWAVLAVILFHFNIPGFSGGFVGVDVFFVISGFLMTGIIIGSLEKTPPKGSTNNGSQSFSIINFYISRARRIIPALTILCLFTLALGWFLLSHIEYKTLGSHVISALGFFSNIQFWQEAGYFDASSHEKLLLHTWSLSVEWQFYLILPLILVATWKARPGRGPLTAIMLAGLSASLLLSIFLSPTKASAAFYLLPTRAWEMLAGGLVYLLANPVNISESLRKTLEAIGFSFVISSIALFDASTVWPGWQALLPVIGTALILVAARQGSIWTGGRITQWLGDCSYSLYLWHWPFAVTLVYLELQGHTGAIAASLALTFLFGWLSYQLVEKPTRNSLSRMPQWQGTGVLAATVLSVVLLSLTVRLQQGVPTRLSENVIAVFDEAENKNPLRGKCHVSGSTPVPECTYGGEKLGVIVIGDSHAGAVIRSIEKSLPSSELHVLDWTMGGCPTISGIKFTDYRSHYCGEFVAKSLKAQLSVPKDIPAIIINRTSVTITGPNEPERASEVSTPLSYLKHPHASRNAEFMKEVRDGLIETACELAKSRPVYMVRPIPELKLHVPNTMGRALMRGNSQEVSISLDEYHKRHAIAWEVQDMAAKRCGVKILNPLPYLCHGGRCQGAVEGLPIYYDDDHLNERGGNLLVPMFRQIFTTSLTAANKKPTPTQASASQDTATP